MTWKQFVFQLVLDHCNAEGNRTFTLRDFYEAQAADLEAFAPQNQHREAKLRQVLQQLRADGLLTFVDNHGTYTLRGVELLHDEVVNPKLVAAVSDDALEREYVKEVNARFRGWVKIARLTYGDLCLLPNCANTFVKAGGERYIEVHHIDALCEGGEEAIWNLSVVCAHHHRMAHFAAPDERRIIRDLLIDRTQTILTRH